jgi:uncharacterized protein (DUF305 family)
MNMKIRTIALVCSALISTVVLAGCTAPDSGTDLPAPSAANSVEGSEAFNSADAMFAMGMVPHHEQAVEMADVVLAKTGIDERVIMLAQQIKAAQDPEIEMMKGWLSDWGINYEDSGMGAMEGMDHGDAMMSQTDMDQLEQADGPQASRLFLEQMIVHHQGAITMSQFEIDNGKNPAAKDLAGAIVTGQTVEVATMTNILATL